MSFKLKCLTKVDFRNFSAGPDFRYTNFLKLRPNPILGTQTFLSWRNPILGTQTFFYYCSPVLKVLYLKTDSHFRYTNIFIVPPVLKFSKLRQNQILDTQTFLLFPLFLNFCSLRRRPIVSTQIFLLFPLFKTNSNVRQNPMSGTQTFYCSPSFNFQTSQSTYFINPCWGPRSLTNFRVSYHSWESEVPRRAGQWQKGGGQPSPPFGASCQG